MKITDRSTWSRNEIFEFFSRTERPFYSVGFRLDVTPVRAFARARGLSFYYALTWLVTEAMNRVEAFRYGIEKGEVVLYERREPSFTDMKPGAEYFHICTLGADCGIEDFCRSAAEASRSQQSFINCSDERPDLIYVSCLPWLELTALTNEGELHKDDSIPRIAWGRYVREGERLMLGFSLEVNHRFIDGAHVGAFAAQLEKLMGQLPL